MTTFNKRSSLTVILFAVAGLAGLMLAHAAGTGSGETTTDASTVTVSEELAAQLAAIEQQPTIDPTNVPDGLMGGTYYSAQFPLWAPLPGNIFHVPVWSLGGDVYLLDDLGIIYGGTTVKADIVRTGTMRNDSTNGGVRADFQTQNGVPYLTITSTGNNAVLVTVWNNLGATNYDIWTTPVLIDPIWTLATNGMPGQSNFVLNLGAYYTGFFRAVLDTNAIPTWEAADPNNPGAGILTVYIDSPTNGAVIQ
jgi:hypothetical protein